MKKYRIAVIALLALFAVAAAACLFSLAYASARGISRQDRQERLAAFRAQEKEFLSLRGEHAAWRKLPGDLRRFRSERLFSMDDYAAFRRDLNLCLDDNGFPAPSISLQFGPVQGRLRPVRIQFALSGSYRSLKKFIFDMEQKPRMQFFERMDLSGSGDKVQGNFDMEAYLEN
jgi:Tfp pilus assembly protein PilO